MLVYEKKVEDTRHLFGTMGNIPSDSDVQLTYKDDKGSSVSPSLSYSYIDDGHGGIKMINGDEKTELNVFISDVNIIPGDFVAPDFTVTVTAGEHGTATADKEEAKAGEEVTLTITPADTYQVDEIVAKDADNKSVTVTNNKFTMPASNVTVTVSFKAAG